MALGKLGDACAPDPLVSMLFDVEQWVRRAAATALGMIGDTSVVDRSLLAVLDDAEWRVREAAIRVLDTLGDSQMVAPLGKGPTRREADCTISASAEAEDRAGTDRANERKVRQNTAPLQKDPNRPGLPSGHRSAHASNTRTATSRLSI